MAARRGRWAGCGGRCVAGLHHRGLRVRCRRCRGVPGGRCRRSARLQGATPGFARGGRRSGPEAGRFRLPQLTGRGPAGGPHRPDGRSANLRRDAGRGRCRTRRPLVGGELGLRVGNRRSGSRRRPRRADLRAHRLVCRPAGRLGTRRSPDRRSHRASTAGPLARCCGGVRCPPRDPRGRTDARARARALRPCRHRARSTGRCVRLRDGGGGGPARGCGSTADAAASARFSRRSGRGRRG